jgi:hypothetical protein
MKRLLNSTLAICALGAAVWVPTGCSPRFIPGTDLQDTPENKDIVAILGKYKAAFEHRDAKTILGLVSPRFYETSGTADPSDDYDYKGLEALLNLQFGKVQDPQLDLDIRKIMVNDEHDKAVVNVYFSSRYQMADAGPTQGFKRNDDTAQVVFQREGDSWKIVSGI